MAKIQCAGHENAPEIVSEIDPTLLDQPFDFCGKGVQSYVFLGRDQKTILKVFKHHHFGLTTKSLSALPFTKNMVKKREARMHSIHRSAAFAWERLPGPAALIGIHLGKTPGLLPRTLLLDTKGRPSPIDLNQCEFILQKRAVPTREYLDQKMREGKGPETLSILFSFLEDLSRQKIKNRDPKILENTGFVDDEPILLDIGSLRMRNKSKNPHPHAKLLIKMERQVSRWIENRYPDQLPSCQRAMREKIDKAH